MTAKGRKTGNRMVRMKFPSSRIYIKAAKQAHPLGPDYSDKKRLPILSLNDAAETDVA
jgi:hypothetical protein